MAIILDHKEWMRISDIILIINGTRDFHEMRRFFLDAIRFLVPYEKAMFYLVEMQGEKIDLREPVFVNVRPAFAHDYERTIDNTVYGTAVLKSHRSIAYRDTDILPEAVRINSDVYNSFLLPNNVPFGGGIILASDLSIEAEITFFRTKSQGDFTSKEIFILDILKQHLEVRFKTLNARADGAGQPAQSLRIKLNRLGLTEREAEIAELIALGQKTAEISAASGTSVFTVKKHIHNIYAKLKLKRRPQLVNLVSGL